MVNKTYKLDNFKVSKLDDLVFKFIKILEKYTDYVIVSGYLAIVFGNSRPTIDIYILFDSFTEENLDKFVVDLKKNDFELIYDPKDLYSIIELNKEKIDIFDKNSNWNFDFKKVRNANDRISLTQHDIVIINGKYKLNIAPIEFQIAYKLAKLGSDKDIKDAAYLYNYFKDELDKTKLKEFAVLLNAKLSKIKAKL